jgi:hypothetical protein
VFTLHCFEVVGNENPMVELALFDNNYKKNFPKFVYKQQQSDDDKLLTQ